MDIHTFDPKRHSWGKLSPREDPTDWHPLEDHCVDVALCARALLEVPILRARLARLGGVEDLDAVQREGTLHFTTAGEGSLEAGRYDVPYQSVSCIVLGPGTSVTHDVLRLLARHGTGLVASGADGVRMYASMPHGPDASDRARSQVRHWADLHGARRQIALKMYEWRMGERPSTTDLNALRGIEGHRVKATYRLLARQHGVSWSGRRYDRSRPELDDPVNMAINHASTAVRGAAHVAVAITGTIPQLGFIHEQSGLAFCLNVADLYRESVVLPAAFLAVKQARGQGSDAIERAARRTTGAILQRKRIVAEMIDRIKELFDADDGGGDP